MSKYNITKEEFKAMKPCKEAYRYYLEHYKGNTDLEWLFNHTPVLDWRRYLKKHFNLPKEWDINIPEQLQNEII